MMESGIFPKYGSGENSPGCRGKTKKWQMPKGSQILSAVVALSGNYASPTGFFNSYAKFYIIRKRNTFLIKK